MLTARKMQPAKATFLACKGYHLPDKRTPAQGQKGAALLLQTHKMKSCSNGNHQNVDPVKNGNIDPPN